MRATELNATACIKDGPVELFIWSYQCAFDRDSNTTAKAKASEFDLGAKQQQTVPDPGARIFVVAF